VELIVGLAATVATYLTQEAPFISEISHRTNSRSPPGQNVVDRAFDFSRSHRRVCQESIRFDPFQSVHDGSPIA
jgi:hypothetical protein